MFNKFFIWLCLIPFIALDGAILRVDKSRSPEDPSQLGSSWSNAFTNLQDALATAQAGDEIWVAEGTYLPTEGAIFQSGYEREQSFRLVDDVSLYGGFKGVETNRLYRQGDSNQTILSGEIHNNPTFWSLHVITGHGLTSDIIIDGFRIEKGNANGVLNQLTDANQTVNVWGVGAGIFLWDFSGNLKIDNCVFTQNYTMPEHGNGDGSCAYINSKERSVHKINVSNTKVHENFSDNSLFKLMPESRFNGIFTVEQFSFYNVDFKFNKATSIDLDIVMRSSQGGIKNAEFIQCNFIENQDEETINFELQKAKFENCTFQKTELKLL